MEGEPGHTGRTHGLTDHAQTTAYRVLSVIPVSMQVVDENAVHALRLCCDRRRDNVVSLAVARCECKCQGAIINTTASLVYKCGLGVEPEVM